LYGPYINDAAGTHLAVFADDTYIYATAKHERLVLCPSLVEEEAPFWNTYMSTREQKSRAQISRRLKPGMALLAKTSSNLIDRSKTVWRVLGLQLVVGRQTRRRSSQTVAPGGDVEGGGATFLKAVS
jgi:hypothetical protein